MKTWHINDNTQLRLIFGARCNVYLLSSNGRHFLIDTSMKGERRFIANRLHRLGVDRLDYLLLTHTHFDHAGNAAFFRQLFRPKVIVHASEAGFLSKGDTPLPEGTNTYTRFLIRLHKKHEIPDFAYEACEPDITIEQRFDLMEVGFPAYVIHTPGHSSGSVSLIINDKVALVGDDMFGQIPGVFYPVFADNESLLIESWKRLLETSCTLFLPGHGKGIHRRKIERYLEKNSAI